MLIALGAFIEGLVGKLVRVISLVVPVKPSFSVFLQYNDFYTSTAKPVQLLPENWFNAQTSN